ncbi:NAD-dependent epimerase/dehydratase family protein [Actinokineospora xionganensis]|uniref:NAD-dependent epimerase/dehydratase family protein n=1 Tax=Actinokineospora xionganensis TaxID=2684470 RepID=A0ABR7L5S0_9PSEU|nr:NAD-dependent epimerase/dehydratase family protein [Actinokineospora xionganensis]MBC6448030.1 NAD-dependent epimerase/dehydratase family protein [Actinokineospora xionganensis]
MKVVVTGASGNVGTALLRAVPQWEAVARRVPPPLRPYQRARWISCDLGDPGAHSVLATACAGADAVVHLAWAIQPPRHDPAMARTNRAGTAAVLRAVAQAGVPQVVSASSVAAYSLAPRWDSVTEDHQIGGVPGSAYSADKAAVETLLDEFEATHPGLRVARIRPCAVAQRDAGAQLARWALSPLVPRRILGNRLLPVPLWPDLRMQVVHSDDVADAIRRMVTLGATGAFNLAADPVLRTTDLAAVLGGFEVTLPRALLSALAAAAWKAGLQPMHPGWLRLADGAPLMASTRARSELDWTPTWDARSALRDLVMGMRAGTGTSSAPLKELAESPRPRALGRPAFQSQHQPRAR